MGSPGLSRRQAQASWMSSPITNQAQPPAVLAHSSQPPPYPAPASDPVFRPLPCSQCHDHEASVNTALISQRDFVICPPSSYHAVAYSLFKIPLLIPNTLTLVYSLLPHNRKQPKSTGHKQHNSQERHLLYLQSATLGKR